MRERRRPGPASTSNQDPSAGWSDQPILVIGDLILDRYVSGDVPRISPEAPVPVLWVADEQLRAGGAANVAANIATLGARPRLLGILGKDSAGSQLKRSIRESGVPVSSLLVDPDRPTIQKTRIVARHQQMLRVDREKLAPLSGQLRKSLCRRMRTLSKGAKVVVLSDYAKGVLTAEVIEQACRLGAPVLVDPKGSDYRRYRGAYLITPNAKEAQEATGISTATVQGCREAARALLRIGGFEACVITRGSQGIYFYTRDRSEGEFPTRARSVFDVTGAGDTVIAVLALARAAGYPLARAVVLANAAAGLVVERFGAATITPAELSEALSPCSISGHKIATLRKAREIARKARAQGRRLVLTNGCFDLMHAGHVESLEFARQQGDFLAVAVNDDPSVRRQKGPCRPVQALMSRMRVLAGLACVDLVVPFSGDTPEAVVRALHPDVLVKGADWERKGVVGQRWVEEHGGRVVLAPILKDHSTSAIIERIRGRGS